MRKKCRDTHFTTTSMQRSLRDCARSCPSFTQLFSYVRSCKSMQGCECVCFPPNLSGDINTCITGTMYSRDTNLYNFIDGKSYIYIHLTTYIQFMIFLKVQNVNGTMCLHTLKLLSNTNICPKYIR